MINDEIKIGEQDRKVNKGYFYISTIALILLVFYISTQSWLYGSILKSYILQIGTISIVIILLIFRPLKDKTLSFAFTGIDLLWSISIIFILSVIFQDGIMKNNNEIFVYITGLLFLIIAKIEIKRYIPSFVLLKHFSLLYAVVTIFHYFYTDIYHSIIFPIISSAAKQRMLELVHLNYYPGLGFAQPSMTSVPMIIGIGLIIAGFSMNKIVVKKKDILLLGILFMGLILAGKRSILMWGLLATLVTYFVAGEAKKKLIRMIKVFSLSLTILFALIIIMNYFNTVPIFSRIVSTIEGLTTGDDVTSGRLILYERAWELFKENPIFGIGWGQFIEVTSGQLLSRDLKVHNVYLQLLSEVGLVGFILILTPIIYSYLKTFETLKIVMNTDNFNSNWRWGISFSFYYQTFFLLYCLSENPFYNMVYMFTYFFCISIVSSFLVININKLKEKKI